MVIKFIQNKSKNQFDVLNLKEYHIPYMNTISQWFNFSSIVDAAIELQIESRNTPYALSSVCIYGWFQAQVRVPPWITA